MINLVNDAASLQLVVGVKLSDERNTAWSRTSGTAVEEASLVVLLGTLSSLLVIDGIERCLF